MKGTENEFVSFLMSTRKLTIPVYQRNYDWKKENCERLFNDLVKTIEENFRTHFFGGIVAVGDRDGGIGHYLIIDGQQRITTVTLLLLALVKLSEEGKIRFENPNFVTEIVNYYLTDGVDKSKIKLKPIKGDAAAFEKLRGDPKGFNQSSNVTLNYKYFYERIQKGELTPDKIYEAVKRLQIIEIKLTPPDDDPQLVFESLNSTGLELSEGDKIRNYILMELKPELQEKYYEEYWNAIEKETHDNVSSSFDVSWFIRDFLSVKTKEIPAIGRVYLEFKKYAEPIKQTDIRPLLEDMLSYAHRYGMLLNGSSELPPSLNASIARLNCFDSSVTRPFFLEVLRLLEEGSISADDATKTFTTIESYLFRRVICDIPTNALNKIFHSLAENVYRFDGTWNGFLDKLRYFLYSRKERARFPDDQEFATGLVQKNVYSMKRYHAYLFERIENRDNKERKPIYEPLEKRIYSVEHIMPQKLTKEWIDSLGPEFGSIYDTWLHRLANLTLTAYNSKYSNSVFKEKRDMEDGFKDSGLWMNQYLANLSQWGENELKARAEYLKDLALTLWPRPASKFVSLKKEFDEYALDDDVSFNFLKLKGYRFNGVEYSETKWIKVYADVLRALHERDKSVLNRLADAENVGLAANVARSGSDPKWRKIDDDLFVYSDSNDYKVRVLLKFFELFGEDPENLVFFIKTDDRNE